MADSSDYRRWMARAEQDSTVIEIIIKDDSVGLEDTLCYLCQQAAEKYLKAYLLYCGDLPSKTHDLIIFILKRWPMMPLYA